MIEFKDVHKYYGDYHALRGINGTIKAGEFFSLLGPSGCGKTTLLRTIAGFEDISSGVIMIDGKDMAECRRQRPAHEHGVPKLRNLPAHERRGKRGLRPAQGPALEGRQGQGRG